MNDNHAIICDLHAWARSAGVKLLTAARDTFYKTAIVHCPSLTRKVADGLFDKADSLAQGARSKAGADTERTVFNAIDEYFRQPVVHRQKKVYDPFTMKMDGYIECETCVVYLSLTSSATRERKSDRWPDEAGRLEKVSGVKPMKLCCLQRDDVKYKIDARLLARLQDHSCARFYVLSNEDNIRALFAFLKSLRPFPLPPTAARQVTKRVSAVPLQERFL